MRRLRLRIALIAALMVMSPIVAHGQTISAAWDANAPADQVTSYQVCIGTASLTCDSQLATVSASETTYTFTPNGGVLYRVAVRAVSAAGTGTYSPEILTSIPALTQPANQTSTINVPISPLSLSANDPDGGTLQFSHTGLPFGLTLNATTGIVSGTPTSSGTFSVTVFVFDGLVTVSRVFTWTVNTGGGDTTAPTLTITSHTSGATVTTSSITLAGTATDSGTGGSGITSVTVNGAAATGGTATGSNTSNWSQTITLATGANVLTVEATDGANNTSTGQITIHYESASSLTLSSLAGDMASPQASGTTITMTARATGGKAPYQYKWWIWDGTLWAIVGDWSSSPTHRWTPAVANSNYRVGVWARSAESTDDTGSTNLSIAYPITPGTAPAALSLTALTGNVASPQGIGTTITFTPTASGGTAPYQFKWWIWNGTVWTMLRGWDSSATYSWTPTTANANYRVGVWVRSAGSTDETGGTNLSIAYPITLGSLTLTGLTANLTSPQRRGTTITFTATATGGTAPYQFKWWIWNGTKWTMVRDWSSTATYSWRPTVANANYRVGVWVRSAGSTDDTGSVNFSMTFPINP